LAISNGTNSIFILTVRKISIITIKAIGIIITNDKKSGRSREFSYTNWSYKASIFLTQFFAATNENGLTFV